MNYLPMKLSCSISSSSGRFFEQCTEDQSKDDDGDYFIIDLSAQLANSLDTYNANGSEQPFYSYMNQPAIFDIGGNYHFGPSDDT